MRAKLFVVLESVFLGLGALILTPSANPKPAANVSSPSQTVAETSRPRLLSRPPEAPGGLGMHHQLVWRRLRWPADRRRRNL